MAVRRAHLGEQGTGDDDRKRDGPRNRPVSRQDENDGGDETEQELEPVSRWCQHGVQHPAPRTCLPGAAKSTDRPACEAAVTEEVWPDEILKTGDGHGDGDQAFT
ncbi:hypothetical protein CON93_21550 [Bacillus toyonensis]|nr:hypothetical protein CON93_21550 [Bacillus toyonensis]PEU33381.1 hypothetical protein CN537_28915 [Bacillus toyonensis]